MSFIAEYHPLFSLASQEDGSERPLAGFSFLPTAACRRELENRRLVLRSSAGALRVFYQTNPLAADPLLGRISSRTRFSFALMLGEPGFFKAYEPDLTASTGPQLYLDNLTPSGNIQSKSTLSTGTTVQAADAARVYPSSFQAPLDWNGGSPPTVFRVKDKFDSSLVLQVAATAAGGGRSITTIDLSAKPTGVYSLDTDVPGSAARTIYVEDELARSPVLGVVDVYWETPQDSAPAAGIAYVVRFKKRS